MWWMNEHHSSEDDETERECNFHLDGLYNVKSYTEMTPSDRYAYRLELSQARKEYIDDQTKSILLELCRQSNAEASNTFCEMMERRDLCEFEKRQMKLEIDFWKETAGYHIKRRTIHGHEGKKLDEQQRERHKQYRRNWHAIDRELANEKTIQKQAIEKRALESQEKLQLFAKIKESKRRVYQSRIHKDFELNTWLEKRYRFRRAQCEGPRPTADPENRTPSPDLDDPLASTPGMPVPEKHGR